MPARHFETGWVQHAVGRVHFEAADYDAAVDALRAMQRHEPHRLEGVELLSTALWHLKDEVELCYVARRAVDADPRSPEAWCASGNCLSLQKEHDGAIRCFHRAIAVAPRFAYAYTLCGHEYVANEDFEKAVAMYVAARIIRRTGSRRRRGRGVDIPWRTSCGDAAAATWKFGRH